MEPKELLQRQISATILQLRMRSPFFATLALFARMHISETILTAATDGRDIFINKRFWESLTPSQRLGLLIHEVLHAALLHVPRRGARDSLLWNIAADIVVNGVIFAQEGFALPDGALRDKELEHLSVEEVYHFLQQHPERCPVISIVDLLWSSEMGAKEYATHEEYWRHALQHAQTISRMLGGHGNVPAGLERDLANLSPSQLDWRSYLWRFLVQTPTDFQSYDRRFVGQGLYLEALTGESVRVYIAVDTSGSIASKEIGVFLGEVLGILSAYPHIIASLYYVDAACYGPYPLSKYAEIPPPVGGGGTDFRPFFTAVQEEHGHQQSGVCVYLTDGYGTFPTDAPPIPTLWVLASGGLDLALIPFGEAVRLVPDAS